jgi:hypothetical protein
VEAQERRSVEGFTTIAARTTRLGRISSAQRPRMTRSRSRRRGERFLERLMINSCCLRRSDSAPRRAPRRVRRAARSLPANAKEGQPSHAPAQS